MEQKINVYLNTQEEGYEVKIKTHQGIPHLVVPVVMMVEGVHSGNHGPLLHKIDDLGKFPDSWNGIPVVVNHPEVDGINVSANSPDILDNVMVGRIYNTKVDDVKLRAEAWVNEAKLGEVFSDFIADIKEGNPIEVSTGMFVEEEDQEGLWHEENYIAIARNIRPDHLALLSEDIGACSIDDGCGIRNNKEGDKMVGKEKKSSAKMVRTKFSNDVNINQKQEVKVEKVEKTPCCEDLVDELIANKRTKYDADDKEWLLTLEEAQLGKMIPEKEKEPEVKVIPEVNKVVEVKTPEKVVEALSDEDKAALAYGHKQLKARRDTMIKGIQDNAGKEIWPDEKLNAFDEDTLQRVFDSVRKDEVVDYSLNGNTELTSNQEDHLFPAGVMEKETK